MAKIVLVGGGSASGKTYVIDQVIDKLGKDNITHFSIDDYYKDLSNLTLEERKKQNFDHPKAFDWKLMRLQLSILKDDKPVDKPTYDYVDSFRFGFALVKEGLEYFFINSKGQKMLTKLLETRFIQTKEDIPKDALNVKILEYLSIIEFLDQTVIVNDKDKKNYLKNLLKVEGLELSDRIKVLKK